MTEYLSIFISTVVVLSGIAVYFFGWILFDRWMTWWSSKKDADQPVYWLRMLATAIFLILLVAIPVSLFIYIMEGLGQ